jgi:hypothetical protein
MAWGEKLRQRQCLGDKRKISSCIYCNYSGNNLTREHNPSKVFLDEPLPDNLPVMYSCEECNSSFSADEAYIASIIECIRCNTYEIEKLEREKIKRVLKNNQKLHSEIKKAFEYKNGNITLDQKKLNNIVLKLARGHLTFEMCEIALCHPTNMRVSFFHNMDEEEISNFESLVEVDLFYEISRATSDIAVIECSLYNEKEDKHIKIEKLFYAWQDVQEGRYRYMCAFNSGLLIVRLVISEFMLAEVIWDTNKIDNLKDMGEKLKIKN